MSSSQMPKYYTINEAAEILRMNPESVRLMIVEHKLGAFRKGGKGKYLITEKQITAFLVPVGADWKRNKQTI